MFTVIKRLDIVIRTVTTIKTLSDVLCVIITNLRTFLELREDEALITQQLFNGKAKIISSSTSSSKKIIRWIKQQEVTVIQNQGLMGNQTITHKPKEELPLKWEIPWRIFSNNFRQTSLRLWSGVKLK